MRRCFGDEKVVECQVVKYQQNMLHALVLRLMTRKLRMLTDDKIIERFVLVINN